MMNVSYFVLLDLCSDKFWVLFSVILSGEVHERSQLP